MQIVLIEGDGIGPEVTQAACRVVAAAGVKIDWVKALAVPAKPPWMSDGTWSCCIVSLIAVVASPIETPSGRLKEMVVATKWPW